ncbi:MAG: hypothetical protein ACR2LI_01185 [Propionibacteriaceae bacterium]
MRTTIEIEDPLLVDAQVFSGSATPSERAPGRWRAIRWDHPGAAASARRPMG